MTILRKRKEHTRCPVCIRLIPLRSMSTTIIPKHRDRYTPSVLCSGSGKPIQRISMR